MLPGRISLNNPNPERITVFDATCQAIVDANYPAERKMIENSIASASP